MRRHHPIVRLTHWVNVLAIAIMVGSGLRIFNAHPGFARIGESFCCYSFEGYAIPRWLTFGGWLAGARNWHFAMMWVLVLNGLVYLGFIYLHGEWRDLVPRRGDPRDAWEMVRFYLALRRDHPRQGKHNTLQKLAYFSMPVVAAVAVMTGLAIWKPVQLAPLTALFGGYVWARYFHFVAMLAIVALAFGHVFMVLSVDPYSLRSMITGGWDPELSPEERNARPFRNLRPLRPAPAAVTATAEGSEAPLAGGRQPRPEVAPQPRPRPQPQPRPRSTDDASALVVSARAEAGQPQPQPQPRPRSADDASALEASARAEGVQAQPQPQLQPQPQPHAGDA